MQIKKLEESVGRPLFVRGPRLIMLTPTGYDLLGYARQIIEVHSTTLTALHGGSLTGRVSIGVPDDYAITYLTPVLRLFSSRFSDVDLTVVREESTSLISRVDKGEIDLAITTRDMPGKGEFLFCEDLVWVGSDQHEVWRNDPLPIALHDLGSRLRAEVLAVMSEAARDYKVVYNSANLIGQLALAESGIAVGVITRCSVPANLKILDSRNGPPEHPRVDVVLMRSKESKRSAAVNALYEQVVRTLKSNL